MSLIDIKWNRREQRAVIPKKNDHSKDYELNLKRLEPEEFEREHVSEMFKEQNQARKTVCCVAGETVVEGMRSGLVQDTDFAITCEAQDTDYVSAKLSHHKPEHDGNTAVEPKIQTFTPTLKASPVEVKADPMNEAELSPRKTETECVTPPLYPHPTVKFAEEDETKEEETTERSQREKRPATPLALPAQRRVCPRAAVKKTSNECNAADFESHFSALSEEEDSCGGIADHVLTITNLAQKNGKNNAHTFGESCVARMYEKRKLEVRRKIALDNHRRALRKEALESQQDKVKLWFAKDSGGVTGHKVALCERLVSVAQAYLQDSDSSRHYTTKGKSCISCGRWVCVCRFSNNASRDLPAVNLRSYQPKLGLRFKRNVKTKTKPHCMQTAVLGTLQKA